MSTRESNSHSFEELFHLRVHEKVFAGLQNLFVLSRVRLVGERVHVPLLGHTRIWSAKDII